MSISAIHSIFVYFYPNPRTLTWNIIIYPDKCYNVAVSPRKTPRTTRAQGQLRWATAAWQHTKGLGSTLAAISHTLW